MVLAESRNRYRPRSFGQKSTFSPSQFDDVKNATPSSSLRKTFSWALRMQFWSFTINRVKTVLGCGRLAIASSSARFAASRYFSIKNDDVCSAFPTLSKPLAELSIGNEALTSISTPSRSRIVFSYSVRLSRRRTTRPCSARRAASAACACVLIQLDKRLLHLSPLAAAWPWAASRPP